VNNDLANVVSYNIIIDAAGKEGKLDLAREKFNEAVNKKIADTITYSSMIDAESKNGNIELAQSLFKEAMSKKIKDDIIYHIYIDALVKHKKFVEAKNIYKNSPLTIPTLKNKNKIMHDFHEFSYGSTYIALDHLLSQTQKNRSFILIIGKGLRSPERRQKHPVKIAVEDYFKIKGISKDSYRFDENNAGKIILDYEPINSNQRVSSAAFWKEKEVAMQINLNPNAPVFIPSSSK